jgi:predicted MFS family arabinose efflux permease
MAVVSVPVTLAGGWLIDRISPVFIGVAMSAAQIVMYVAVPELDTDVGFALTIVTWGTANALFAILTAAALPKLFGRRHLGEVAGAQMSLMVIGSAIGPALFAAIDSAAGSYRAALWVSLVVPVAGIVAAVASSRTPRH